MLTKNDIEKYLSIINSKLRERNLHGDIVLTGGAVMSLVYDAREFTKDIDALFVPTEAFREIIDEISYEEGLPPDWLNDGVKGFLNHKMGHEVFAELPNLVVYTMNPESMLALKLTSARTDSQDMEDALVISELPGYKYPGFKGKKPSHFSHLTG